MVSPDAVKRLLVIVGPTASGKSALALDVAKQIGGEIVNADSRQFYTELNIGTAKPEPSDRIIVPHHLLDVASIQGPLNAGDFVKLARESIEDICRRGLIPIVVGGTGLYVRALLYGLDEVPPADVGVREKLRQRHRVEGIVNLRDELMKLDPVSAKRLNPNDADRILRALEVFLSTGQPIHSFWGAEKKSDLDFIKIGLSLPREELYRRIDLRVLKMATHGLKEETRTLWHKFPDNVILKKTIGYQEWITHHFKDDAIVVAEIQKNSRHFAKRQMTWFGKENDIRWLEANDSSLLDTVIRGYHETT